MSATLLQLDQQHVWHPCSQMKDYATFPPLLVKAASGCYIELANGAKIIDAISSWWCKSLGHQHPRLKAALLAQAEQFEHVIFANTTNEPIVQLSQQLTQLAPGLNKVFYAGDGSCAVEIAMKMSLHARALQQQPRKKKFMALANGYHGETFGALSVSDVGIYRNAYASQLMDCGFIENIPYVLSQADALWHDCSAIWAQIVSVLAQAADELTAIIIEPILQGAGGMRIYSADFLRRLSQWAQAHDVHLIADEIMTGLGRTGKMLACDYANMTPDFLCLGKGLTAGWMPFSAVLTRDAIYDLFYDDYEHGKSFLHSHTYSGHVLGAKIALAVLAVLKEEQLCQRANAIGKYMYTKMLRIAQDTGVLNNVRQIGATVAADIICHDAHKRVGYNVMQTAVKLGALLRPLGNTIYWLPPLNIEYSIIDTLADITREALLCELTSKVI